MIDDTLLMILNPRELDECMISLERLRVPKVWLRCYTEWQLQTVIPSVLSSSDYAYYAVIGDDCVVSEDAYQAVVDLAHEGHPVVTGYCNLDTSTPMAALTKTPFPEEWGPTEFSYDWYSLDEIRDMPDNVPIPTHFAGMAFTCMSKEMWGRFPWKSFNPEPGCCADYTLALRLRDAGIPIVAPKRGYIYHTKQRWQNSDTDLRRRLRIGEDPTEVVWDESKP